jgi:hypothetical protein
MRLRQAEPRPKCRTHVRANTPAYSLPNPFPVPNAHCRCVGGGRGGHRHTAAERVLTHTCSVPSPHLRRHCGDLHHPRVHRNGSIQPARLPRSKEPTNEAGLGTHAMRRFDPGDSVLAVPKRGHELQGLQCIAHAPSIAHSGEPAHRRVAANRAKDSTRVGVHCHGVVRLGRVAECDQVTAEDWAPRSLPAVDSCRKQLRHGAQLAGRDEQDIAYEHP